MPRKCSECNGTGTWSSGCDGLVDCNPCSGTGYVERGDCKSCEGTGYRTSYYNVDRPVCETCAGTGHADRRSR